MLLNNQVNPTPVSLREPGSLPASRVGAYYLDR